MSHREPLLVKNMVVVRKGLAVADEVFRLLLESRNLGAKESETSPFGIEENRRNLEVAIDYVYRQNLIPRRFAVDELFER